MLTRWNPFSELERLQDEFFRSLGRTAGGELATGAFSLPVDIVEEKDHWVLKAEVPGMKPGDVEITVEGGVLTLKGERKFEHEDKGDNYRRIERAYGSFSRSFTLPKAVDAEHLSAEMADGVLTVTIPKLPEVQPKRIEIKAGAQSGGKKQLTS